MQARRLLLVIGIVMLLAVAAASLVPPPERVPDGESATEQTTETGDPSPPVQRDDGGAIEIEFSAEGPAADGGAGRRDQLGRPDRNRAAQTKTVRAGKRVIVTVTSPGPGTVELEGLGRLQMADRGNPAIFDLFTDQPGRFEVTVSPADGDERVIGTLAVERRPADAAG